MPFSAEPPCLPLRYQGRPWIDSHCHFDFEIFDPDRDGHWQLLQQWGCAGLVIPGIGVKQWSKLVSVCKQKPWFYALGLHPYFLAEQGDNDMVALETCLGQQQQSSQLVAVGEFGLDFALPVQSHAQQVWQCEQQLRLAQRFKLPIILHVRKAYDEICAIVRRMGFDQGGIVHAFSGSYQQAQALLALGFKLGIGGALSHNRANKLRHTVSRLHLQDMVLETDAPDMRPAFWQSARNSPLSLLMLAQIVASLQQCSLDDVILSSNNNMLAVIPKLSIDC